METMIVFLIVAAAVFLGVRALRGPAGGCGCSNGSGCGSGKSGGTHEH